MKHGEGCRGRPGQDTRHLLNNYKHKYRLGVDQLFIAYADPNVHFSPTHKRKKNDNKYSRMESSSQQTRDDAGRTLNQH